MPSPSVSRSLGSLPEATSSASLRPSLSESADFGLVPSLNSLTLLSRSLSESLFFQEPVRWYLAAKAAAFGFFLAAAGEAPTRARSATRASVETVRRLRMNLSSTRPAASAARGTNGLRGGRRGGA